MNTFIKFVIGFIFFGGALAFLAMGFTIVMIWWIDISGSAFVSSLPFLIIGGLMGIEYLDE